MVSSLQLPPTAEVSPIDYSDKSSPSESKEDVVYMDSRATSISVDKYPLAERTSSDPASSLGDAVLRLLRLRAKRPEHSLDSVATQNSVFDTEQGEYYQPRADWEVSKGLQIPTAWKSH